MPLFLMRASFLLNYGGKVAISFPQSLTRSTIPQEIKHFLHLAQRVGLTLLQIDRNATQYSVPPFEQIAYKRIGLHISSPWRQGDLLLFQKTAPYQDIPDMVARANPRWQQFPYDKFRLFLKRDGRSEIGRPSITAV